MTAESDPSSRASVHTGAAVLNVLSGAGVWFGTYEVVLHNAFPQQAQNHNRSGIISELEVASVNSQTNRETAIKHGVSDTVKAEEQAIAANTERIVSEQAQITHGTDPLVAEGVSVGCGGVAAFLVCTLLIDAAQGIKKRRTSRAQLL